MHRLLKSAACLFAWVLTASCGGAVQAVTTEAEAPLDLLAVLPPGPSQLIHVRPSELMSSEVLGPIMREFIGAEDLERIELRFGLRPSEVEELVFAEYDDGFIVIARATLPVQPIAEAIASRMNTVELESEEPLYRRGGFVGTQRRELAVIRDQVIAYGTMAPPMAGLVARVGRQVPNVRSVESAWLDSSAPLVFYRLTPFDFPIDSPVGMVFAQQRRARASFVADGGAVGVQLAFDGEFPPDADRNLRMLVSALARSDLGRLIGLDEAYLTLDVSQSQGRLSLEAVWPAAPLRSGLRRVLAPNIQVLLGDAP